MPTTLNSIRFCATVLLFLHFLGTVDCISTPQTFRIMYTPGAKELSPASKGVIELSVPGINFLRRFAGPCWHMNPDWMGKEIGNQEQIPWPDLPLGRVFVAQRYYAAGITFLNSQNWTAASDSFATALHLMMYPYTATPASIHNWEIVLASNNPHAVSMRTWIGRLLVALSKTQVQISRIDYDLHRVDMAYLASEAAISLLISSQKSKEHFLEDGIKVLFPGDTLDMAYSVADAEAVRIESAEFAAHLLSTLPKFRLEQELANRQEYIVPMTNAGAVMDVLATHLSMPFTKSVEATHRLPNGEGDDNNRAILPDEKRMNSRLKEVQKLSSYKALKKAAIITAHASGDWLRREVGIVCHSNAIKMTGNARSCSVLVDKLWDVQWKTQPNVPLDQRDDVTHLLLNRPHPQTLPSPASTLESVRLLQAATVRINGVITGAATSERHVSGFSFVNVDGYHWELIEAFYGDSLETPSLSHARQEKPRSEQKPIKNYSPPPGSIDKTASVCIDITTLQLFIMNLDEPSLRDLVGALAGLSAAQALVGGPHYFWSIVQDHNRSISDYDFMIITAIEAAKLTGGSKSKAVQRAQRDVAVASSPFGLSIGLPPYDSKPWYFKFMYAIRKMLNILVSRGSEVLVDIFFFFAALTALASIVYYIDSQRIKFQAARRKHLNKSKPGRSTIPAHLIVQRSSAALALRDAIAAESVSKLIAALKLAEDYGVEKPLIKKGKNLLHHLKKRNKGTAPPSATPTMPTPSSSTTPMSVLFRTGSGKAYQMALRHSPPEPLTVSTDQNSGSDWKADEDWTVVSPKSSPASPLCGHNEDDNSKQEKPPQQPSTPTVSSATQVPCITKSFKPEAVTVHGASDQGMNTQEKHSASASTTNGLTTRQSRTLHSPTPSSTSPLEETEDDEDLDQKHDDEMEKECKRSKGPTAVQLPINPAVNEGKIEMKKLEGGGSKQPYNVVLVKRSSLQRPPPASVAVGAANPQQSQPQRPPPPPPPPPPTTRETPDTPKMVKAMSKKAEEEASPTVPPSPPAPLSHSLHHPIVDASKRDTPNNPTKSTESNSLAPLTNAPFANRATNGVSDKKLYVDDDIDNVIWTEKKYRNSINQQKQVRRQKKHAGGGGGAQVPAEDSIAALYALQQAAKIIAQHQQLQQQIQLQQQHEAAWSASLAAAAAAAVATTSRLVDQPAEGISDELRSYTSSDLCKAVGGYNGDGGNAIMATTSDAALLGMEEDGRRTHWASLTGALGSLESGVSAVATDFSSPFVGHVSRQQSGATAAHQELLQRLQHQRSFAKKKGPLSPKAAPYQPRDTASSLLPSPSSSLRRSPDNTIDVHSLLSSQSSTASSQHPGNSLPISSSASGTTLLSAPSSLPSGDLLASLQHIWGSSSAEMNMGEASLAQTTASLGLSSAPLQPLASAVDAGGSGDWATTSLMDSMDGTLAELGFEESSNVE